MKSIFKWQIALGLLLILLSTIIYLIHFLIFRDAHHIFIYLIGDIAFVFFEVLLVTLVIHQLLHYREKKALLQKLNMVIGAFFTEVGIELLKVLSHFHPDKINTCKQLIIKNDWSENKFYNCIKDIKKIDGQGNAYKPHNWSISCWDSSYHVFQEQGLIQILS